MDFDLVSIILLALAGVLAAIGLGRATKKRPPATELTPDPSPKKEAPREPPAPPRPTLPPPRDDLVDLPALDEPSLSDREWADRYISESKRTRGEAQED